MKKLFLMLLAAGTFTIAANAQEAAAKQEAKPQLTKEQKAEQKAKREAEINDAMKQAGFTDDEMKKAKEIMAWGMEERNKIKKENAGLTPEELKEKQQPIKDQEKQKLTDLLGSKYKAFKEVQKKQKEAAGATMEAK